MDKLKEYLKSIDNISHITIDPNGPGVIRAHLVPPKNIRFGIPWTLIINGTHMIPVNTSWAILLREYIDEANREIGEVIDTLNDSTVRDIAIKNTMELFPKAKKEMLEEDLKSILDTLQDLAKGKNPSVYIGYMPLSKAAKYLKAPHRVDLMISSMYKNGAYNCNQNCLICYASNEVEATKDEISTEEWKKIIDNLKKSGVSQLTFTGGEPTIRDDLVELVDYSKWFVTRLNTNGVLLSQRLCRDLYEASLDSVQVTLYSDNKNIHNILVGKDNFDATIEGIKNAVAAGLNVSINTPLTTLNEDYVGLLKLGKSLGIRYFTCSGIIKNGNALESDRNLSYEKMHEILKLATNYCYKNNLEIDFTSPGVLSDVDLKNLHLTIPSCGACLSNMAIAPNGDVLPCQSYLNMSLGNLKEQSFESIFNSKDCKKIRKRSSLDEHVCYLHKEETK